jgi:hypothetical protein
MIVSQEVRWQGGAIDPAEFIHIFCGKGNENQEISIGIFAHKGNMSAVKRLSLLVIGCHT